MNSIKVNRPRDVDWRRAAAFLYGDWGTSKAYVIGAAFFTLGFSSMPIILAVSLLTGVVGAMYMIVCRYFPEGGGVYSAARMQSRLLASVGGLLLVADLTVTAALSGWSALTYFGIPAQYASITTMGVILALGFLNFFGPRHSGSVAISLAVPTVITVVIIVCLSVPHLVPLGDLLRTPHVAGERHGFGFYWVAFVNVILALSGVEAIANLTGVMRLDPGSSPDAPRVGRTAFKSILVVAIEVVFGTIMIGWAMLSLPRTMADELHRRWEDMLRVLAEQYGTLTLGPAFGHWFGIVVAIVIGLLLLSAVNTALNALIGVMFMMSADGELPYGLGKLNRHGVPIYPLVIAVALPVIVLAVSSDFQSLMHLYAIGVVGAIAVNLGSCTSNRQLGLKIHERVLMGCTFCVLAAVEITLAKTKPEALFFIVCIVGVGLGVRAFSHRISGLKTLTLPRDLAEVISPASLESLRPQCVEGQRIMVAARGVTPVLRFALEEARLRKATLCVLYIREVAVFLGSGPQTVGPARWQDDPHAAVIMSLCLRAGEDQGVSVLPVYAASVQPAGTILDAAATLGVDYLMLGATQRLTLARLLKGNVIDEVARGLPESIQLIIHG